MIACFDEFNRKRGGLGAQKEQPRICIHKQGFMAPSASSLSLDSTTFGFGALQETT